MPIESIPVLLPIFAANLFIFYIFMVRRTYKNIKKGGPFFFENGCLVVNTGLPYQIPMEEIEYVELRYSPWEVENKLSYSLWCKVVKKDGKSKSVFHKGYRGASYGVHSDMAASVTERGIRCVLIKE